MATKTDQQYDLFISYAAADSAWVRGYLLDALTLAGINYYSEEAFTLGAPRLLEFERAVVQSRRTLLILTPAYLADGSSQFIDLLAQTHGMDSATWPVIPLKLLQVTLPPRLAILTGLDATDAANWQEVVERLCREFQRPLPAPTSRPECPYPGLRAFDESESHLFFGRTTDIEEIKNQLRLHPFTVVIGPSGSGKSSLVFAGLIPELRRTQLFGPGGWAIRRIRPGNTPLRNLEGSLEGVSLDPKQAVAKTIAAETGARRLLLIVDQFEELFTQGGDEVRSFQEVLMSLVGTPDFYLVLTARADFYPDLMGSPLWPQIRLYRHEVLPLGESGLRQAIMMPAEEVNVLVESSLIERMVADASGEPGILPFVQETMRLLWEHVERRLLPLSAYEALVLPRKAYGNLGSDTIKLSGLQVAIALHADVALKDLDDRQQTIARRIFLRLVQFGEGRADTRRQQPVDDLRSGDDDPEVFAGTLRHLGDRRLLTLSGKEDKPDTSVDIAHEALITGWYTLRQWISERREAELTRRRLEAKAREWVRFGEGEGGLLDETELAEADRYTATPDAAELGHDIALKKLLERSRTAIDEAREKIEEARRRELALEVAARKAAQTRNRIAAVLLVLVTGLAIFAFFQRYRAQKSAQEVRRQTVLNLSTFARSNLASNQPLEVLFSALTAGQLVKDPDWQSETPLEALLALQQAVYGVRERNRLQGHAAEVMGLSVSGDGRLLTSGSSDKMVLLWRRDGTPIKIFGGHEDGVTEVIFSPDGQTIASSAMDRTIRFWDLEGNTKRIIQVGNPNDEQDSNWISSIAFNADGKQIAAACADGTVKLWNLSDNSPPRIFTGHSRKVIEVTFIPHSELIASAGEDGLVILWNLNGDRQKTIDMQGGKAFSVAASSDGQSLATSGQGRSIKLWSLDGKLKKVFQVDDDSVLNVRFSPDGQTLASAGQDGTVRLWSLADDSQQVFRGHQGAVAVVRFSPDGQTVFSGGVDGSVRVWSVAPELPVMKHDDTINAVRFSPDGQTLASCSDDRSIKLWRLDGGLLRTISGHPGPVFSISFSPDGKTIASGGEDFGIESQSQISLVRLWDLNGAVKNLGSHAGTIREVTFSPDGKSVASASADKTVKLWSLDGQLLQTLDNRSEANSVSFSPDGNTIASAGSDHTIKLWSPSGALLQTLSGHSESVLTVRFSADSNVLASGGSDNTVRIWIRHNEKFQSVVLPGHSKSINRVTFKPGSLLLVSASTDNTIKFWELFYYLQTVGGHSDGVLDISFAPDGKTLASAGFDNRVVIWNLDLDDLLARGCRSIRDYLKTNPRLSAHDRRICDNVVN